jgi:hypothetical protein
MTLPHSSKSKECINRSIVSFQMGRILCSIDALTSLALLEWWFRALAEAHSIVSAGVESFSEATAEAKSCAPLWNKGRHEKELGNGQM